MSELRCPTWLLMVSVKSCSMSWFLGWISIDFDKVQNKTTRFAKRELPLAVKTILSLEVLVCWTLKASNPKYKARSWFGQLDAIIMLMIQWGQGLTCAYTFDSLVPTGVCLTCTYKISNLGSVIPTRVGWGGDDKVQVRSKTDLSIDKTKGWGGMGWGW